MAQRGEIQLEAFKVLEPKITKGFEFYHSSRLYPEWPVAACSITDQKLARNVAKALVLLNYSHEAMSAAKVYKWTYPSNYAEVTECLRVIGAI